MLNWVGERVLKWAYFCIQPISIFICLNIVNMSALSCYTGLRSESPIFFIRYRQLEVNRVTMYDKG